MLVYIDNIIIIGNDPIAIDLLKHCLHSKFKLKDLGPLKYFLGIEVAWVEANIHLSQWKYVLEVITDVGLLDIYPIDFLVETTVKPTPSYRVPLTNPSV